MKGIFIVKWVIGMEVEISIGDGKFMGPVSYYIIVGILNN